MENRISNPLVLQSYNALLENHTAEETATIMLNSLSILGAKNIIITDSLNEEAIKRINKYKYPERLSLFLNTTNDRSTEWKNNSFAKIALH
jgi:hypothetical protein